MVGERRRRGRRGALARRLVRVGIPVLVGALLVVLAVSAVAQVGRQSGPYRRSVDRGYAALAQPLVAMSNASGSSLRALLGDAASLGRQDLFARLDTLATDTATVERLYSAITPPEPATSAARRCAQAMDARARAAASLRRALEGVVGGRTGLTPLAPDAAASALRVAGTTLHGADLSWAACRRGLLAAPGTARLPASLWLPDPGVLTDGSPAAGDTGATRLVDAVAGSRSLAPVHRLAIVAVVTEPPAVTSGHTQVVVPTVAVRADVVLADEGNVDEKGVEVGAVAQLMGAPASPAPVQRTVDLAAGGSTTVMLPALAVRPGSTYSLLLTAEGPRASGTGPIASRAITVQVQPAATNIAVLSSSTRTRAGTRVVLSATVTTPLSGVGTPTGTVEFEADGAAVAGCATRPVHRGTATCTTTFPAAGIVAVSGVYSGDPRFAGSTSPSLTVRVVRR